jgi:hypothetical protein
MSKTLLISAVAGGLGAALALEYGMAYVPASIQGFAGGNVAKYGVPVVGAMAGLWVASLVK